MIPPIKNIIFPIFILLILGTSYSYSIATTANTIHSQSNYNDSKDQQVDTTDESFSLFLLILGGTFIGLFIGIGALLTAIALVGIFALISFGVISVSVMIGIFKKSFQKGFETLVLLSSCILGLGAGILFFYLGNIYLHWMTTNEAMGIGAIAGLTSGFLLGVLAIIIVQRLSTLLKQKLEQ